jgi:beta-phosphoglucomutase-like phosphatase (HAD superfamily)
MFDIDGTLINSYELDSKCFVDAVNDVTGISINSDWSTYHHVTDSGILGEVLHNENITDKPLIEASIKQVFLEKLEKTITAKPIEEIPGAISFIAYLKKADNIVVSLATGGWYESAMLKLKSAGIDISGIPIASANDSTSRTDIMKLAASRATGKQNTPCTYFGDDAWDKAACEKLGFNFILVGDKLVHKPSIENFKSISSILSYLDVSSNYLKI